MPTGVYERTDDYRASVSARQLGTTRKPLSEETKAKISAAHKGKKHTAEHIANFIIARRGIPVSEETRAKLSAAQTGRVISQEHREKLRVAMIGRVFSEEWKAKLSIAHIGLQAGEKCYKWKGGISFAPYCPKFDNARKRAVRSFFKHHCIVCGSHQSELKLTLAVHHIDHDKEQGCSGKPFNLVPLCSSCHSKEQYSEEEYRAYINKTLRHGFVWGVWSEQEYATTVMY